MNRKLTIVLSLVVLVVGLSCALVVPEITFFPASTQQPVDTAPRQVITVIVEPTKAPIAEVSPVGGKRSWFQCVVDGKEAFAVLNQVNAGKCDCPPHLADWFAMEPNSRFCLYDNRGNLIGAPQPSATPRK